MRSRSFSTWYLSLYPNGSMIPLSARSVHLSVLQTEEGLHRIRKMPGRRRLLCLAGGISHVCYLFDRADVEGGSLCVSLFSSGVL